MPKASSVQGGKAKKAGKASTKAMPDDQNVYDEDVATPNSEQSSDEQDLDDEPQTSKGRKRPNLPEQDDEGATPGAGGDYNNNEMQRMLECFGGEIFKARLAKKKRLEQFTTGTLKTTNRRVDDIWKGQNAERQKLHDEFSRQVSGVFTQWEGDVEKTKGLEEKLTDLFRQQQKLFQQTRIIQCQRLKTLKSLHEEYIKGLGNLEKCHADQQGSVQGELRKEMLLLQKKILMDTQQQEVMSFKKSLQNMLY